MTQTTHLLGRVPSPNLECVDFLPESYQKGRGYLRKPLPEMIGMLLEKSRPEIIGMLLQKPHQKGYCFYFFPGTQSGFQSEPRLWNFNMSDLLSLFRWKQKDDFSGASETLPTTSGENQVLKGIPVWEPRPKIKGTNRLVCTLSGMHLPYNVLPTNSFLRSFILSFPSFPSFFLLPPNCLSPFPMISQPSKPSKNQHFPIFPLCRASVFRSPKGLYLPTLSDVFRISWSDET